MLGRKLLVVGGGNATGVDHFCISLYGQEASFVGLLGASGELSCSLPIVAPPGISCIPDFVMVPPPKSAASYFQNYYPGQIWGNFSAPFSRALDFLECPNIQSLTSDRYQATGLLDRMLFAGVGFNCSKPRLVRYLRAYAPTDVIVEVGMHDAFDLLLVDDNQQDLLAIATKLVGQLSEICSVIAEFSLRPIVFTIPSPVALPYFQSVADLSKLRTISGHKLDILSTLSPRDLVPLPLVYRSASGSGKSTSVLAAHDLVPVPEARAVAVMRAVAHANAELRARLPALGLSLSAVPRHLKIQRASQKPDTF